MRQWIRFAALLIVSAGLVTLIDVATFGFGFLVSLFAFPMVMTDLAPRHKMRAGMAAAMVQFLWIVLLDWRLHAGLIFQWHAPFLTLFILMCSCVVMLGAAVCACQGEHQIEQNADPTRLRARRQLSTPLKILLAIVLLSGIYGFYQRVCLEQRTLAMWDHLYDSEKADLESLLVQGVDIDPRDEDEYSGTSLMRAAAYGQTKVVQLLLKYGADVNARDHDGVTALMSAAGAYHTQPTLSVLLDHGARIDAQDIHGETALMTAVQRASEAPPSEVRLLLDRGADVNRVDEDGATALMYAVDPHAYVHSVRLLLEHGAKVNARSHTGNTALSLAKRDGFQILVQMLQRAGAR